MGGETMDGIRVIRKKRKVESALRSARPFSQTFRVRIARIIFAVTPRLYVDDNTIER